MTNLDFSEKILSLLQDKKYAALQKYLETLEPADIAECMTDLLDDGELEERDLLRLFRLFGHDHTYSRHAACRRPCFVLRGVFL